MKNREEFLGSVYAKRDAELARRKIYKKKLYSGLAAAAACMVLVVGVTSGGLADLAGAASEQAADEALMEPAVEDGAAGVDTSEIANGSGPQDMQADPGASSGSAAYYMLPCVTIEDRRVEGESTEMHAAGIDTVEKVRAWVDSLMESGQVMAVTPGSEDVGGDAENDASRTKPKDCTCIVTFEYEPQVFEIYYLTGEVGWYE